MKIRPLFRCFHGLQSPPRSLVAAATVAAALVSGAPAALAQFVPTPAVDETKTALAPPAATPAPSPLPTPDATRAPLPNAPGALSGPPPATNAPGGSSPAPAQPDQAEQKVARAEPVNIQEITTRIQIFLDQQNFGPGKIDGRPGEFTLKAIGRYQLAHGLQVTSKIEDGTQLPLESVYPIYTTYTVKAGDFKRIGNVPGKPEEQAKQKSMPYPTMLKFLEERYHSDPDFLVKLNKGRNFEKLVAGDEVRVPNVAPFEIEKVQEIGKLPTIPEFKVRRIHVDTQEKMLDLYQDQALIASFPITPGSDKLPAPPGTWKILGIATLPWFRHDEGVLNYGVRTSHFFNIPAGPSNPVGVAWVGLNKPGIGLHGTSHPETIGRAGSHGCIRLANWDVSRLIWMISDGMTVVIDDGIPVPKGQKAKSHTDPAKVSASGVPLI